MPTNRPIPYAAAAIAAALLLPAASAAVPAATDHVVLNEVLATPADGGVEAVELYNPTTGDVNVTGWTLEDNWSGCFEHEDAGFPHEIEGTIEAGGTKVVDLPNPRGGFSCLNLAQDGDVLLLHDDQGQRVDAVCWGDGCDAYTDAHEAPAGVEPGNTTSRCFLFSGEGEGLSDEDAAPGLDTALEDSPAEASVHEVDWTAGPPTLGARNDPCVF